MKRKRARFDTLVARYYPAVYTFASRLTDDPLEAVLLTHEAFNSTRKQLRNRRDVVELVTTLLDAVIRAGFVAARFKSHVTLDKGKMARLVLNCEERCMTSDYQEKAVGKQTLIKPKGDPQYIHTESGGRTKQSVAVGGITEAGPSSEGRKQCR
jgi:hypothetical protein